MVAIPCPSVALSKTSQDGGEVEHESCSCAQHWSRSKFPKRPDPIPFQPDLIRVGIYWCKRVFSRSHVFSILLPPPQLRRIYIIQGHTNPMVLANSARDWGLSNCGKGSVSPAVYLLSSSRSFFSYDSFELPTYS